MTTCAEPFRPGRLFRREIDIVGHSVELPLKQALKAHATVMIANTPKSAG